MHEVLSRVPDAHAGPGLEVKGKTSVSVGVVEGTGTSGHGEYAHQQGGCGKPTRRRFARHYMHVDRKSRLEFVNSKPKPWTRLGQLSVQTLPSTLTLAPFAAFV